MNEYAHIGRSALRKEARAKLTGAAQFTDDLRIESLLHGATVRSQVPRGRITAIRFEEGIPWDEFVMDSEVYRTFILATNEGNTDLPFYMGENSCANLQPIGGAATVRPDGWNRERFLKTSIMEVIRCMKEGVPIKGYLYWGLVDDFEWQAGFAPRLGLYNYDYVNGLINPTDGFGEPSGQVYAHLVAALRSGRKGLIQDCFVRTYAASLTRSGR